MSEEKTALAHIDFLIDQDVREKLGITTRDLDTQVLRLCGGFNDLQAENKKYRDLLEEISLMGSTPSCKKAEAFLKENPC